MPAPIATPIVAIMSATCIAAPGPSAERAAPQGKPAHIVHLAAATGHFDALPIAQLLGAPDSSAPMAGIALVRLDELGPATATDVVEALLPEIEQRDADDAEATAAGPVETATLLLELATFPYHNAYAIGSAVGSAVSAGLMFVALPVSIATYVITNRTDEIPAYIATVQKNLSDAIPNIVGTVQKEIAYDVDLFRKVVDQLTGGAPNSSDDALRKAQAETVTPVEDADSTVADPTVADELMAPVESPTARGEDAAADVSDTGSDEPRPENADSVSADLTASDEGRDADSHADASTAEDTGSAEAGGAETDGTETDTASAEEADDDRSGAGATTDGAAGAEQ